MARTKKNAEATLEVEENVSEEKESRVSVYEVGYIMVPTIAEENLGGEVTSFKDMFLENENRSHLPMEVLHYRRHQ